MFPKGRTPLRQVCQYYCVFKKKNNRESGITGCLLSGKTRSFKFWRAQNKLLIVIFENKCRQQTQNVLKLNDEEIGERLFSTWLMKLAPFDDLEWSDREFESGNFLKITNEQALNVFIRLNEYSQS